MCSLLGGRYGEVPIIANGNVRTWSDVQDNLLSTSADGIMSAEGLLDNPALFNGGVAVDALQLAEEYLDLVERFPTKLKSVVFHIRRMCRELLTSYQVGRVFFSYLILALSRYITYLCCAVLPVAVIGGMRIMRHSIGDALCADAAERATRWRQLSMGC